MTTSLNATDAAGGEASSFVAAENYPRLTKAGKKRNGNAYNVQPDGDRETPGAIPAGLGGIAMYRLVYWSGVTAFVVWSVFSALGALHVF